MKKGILFCCIIIAMLLVAIGNAMACETDKCRASWGHRGGGAFVGASSVALFRSINGEGHTIKTGVEAMLLSVAISAITEATAGSHGKPSGKDFGQWVQGNVFGVGTNLFILEYKF